MAKRAFVLEEATIESVQSAVLHGEISCRELVQSYLDHIEAFDRSGPSLKALLAIAPDALDQADAQDRLIASSPGKRPLQCVPVILKDNYNTADMPTTGGASVLKGMQPAKDAFVVARLRKAGAIILAKSNLQELALGGNTVSSLGGQTLNPYDLTRTPGGSSGGTGAAIAANLGLVGAGSDTGQSIRSPASALSLVGLRPTRGLVSRSGIMPCSLTQDEVGPITRTVEDAARMLDVMTGYDPDDPITAAGIGHRPESYLAYLVGNALRGARIGLLTDLFGVEDVHEETNTRTREAAALMRSMGAQIVEFSIPDLDVLTADMVTVAFEMRAAFDAYLADIGKPPQRSLKAIYGKEKFAPEIKETLQAAVECELGTADPAYLAIFKRRDDLRKAVLNAMASHRLDAILYPHQKRLVVKIGEEQVERNGVLSNGTGFPAITIPGGFSSPSDTAPIGVPIGIELLGRPFSEGRLLGYAYAFEQHAALRRSPVL